jgi:hypothetical protein
MGTENTLDSTTTGVTNTSEQQAGGGWKSPAASFPSPVSAEVERRKPGRVWAGATVDAGKRTVEVLPGIKLVAYSRGYVALRVKHKGRPEANAVLYRDGVKRLIERLQAEVESTLTYEEANGMA